MLTNYGSNVHILIRMNRLNLVIGTERTEIPSFDQEYQPLEIWQTDRFLYEIKDLRMHVKAEKNQSELTMKMGVEKLEISEEFAADNDPSREQPVNNAGGADQEYGSLFKKLLFWNNRESAERKKEDEKDQN